MTNKKDNGEEKSISSVYGLFDYIIKGTNENRGVMKRSGAIIVLMCVVGLIASLFLETEEMAIVFPIVGEIVKYGLGIGLILFLFSLIGEGKSIEKKEAEAAIEIVSNSIAGVDKNISITKLNTYYSIKHGSVLIGSLKPRKRTLCYLDFFVGTKDPGTKKLEENFDRLNTQYPSLKLKKLENFTAGQYYGICFDIENEESIDTYQIENLVKDILDIRKQN